MEVSLINAGTFNKVSGLFNRDFAEKTAGNDQLKEKIREEFLEESRKAMMDIEDVQKFLYMLIGSKITLESEGDAAGHKINEIA